MTEKILVVPDPLELTTEAELVMNTSLADRGFDYDITFYECPVDYVGGYYRYRDSLPNNYLDYDQIWYLLYSDNNNYLIEDLDKLIDFVIGKGKSLLMLGEWARYFYDSRVWNLEKVFRDTTGKTLEIGPSLFPNETYQKPITGIIGYWNIMVPTLNNSVLENLDQNPIQLTTGSYASSAIGTMRIENPKNGLFTFTSDIGFRGNLGPEEGFTHSPYGAITVWPEKDMVTKKGRLAIIMDYNWLTPETSYLEYNKNVIWSLVYFLSKAQGGGGGGGNVTPALRLNQRDDQQGLSPTARLELSASNSYQTNNSSRIFGGMYL